MSSLLASLDYALSTTSNEQTTSAVGDVCTYCVTGTILKYQGVYKCRTCTRKSSSTKQISTSDRICFGCSQTCHRGHKLELLGYENSSCKCGASGCLLSVKTREQFPSKDPFRVSQFQLSDNRFPFSVHKFNTIPGGNDLPNMFELIKHQCIATICESKETFWVGANWKYSNEQKRATIDTDIDQCRCDLEDLALLIFRYHTEDLKLSNHFSTSSSSSSSSVAVEPRWALAGAEWWIQIKNLEASVATGTDAEQSSVVSPTIELHYDKDEELAENWGVEMNPDLSTVTYLSDGHYSPHSEYVAPQPTVIYSNTTSCDVGEPIHDCYLSFPKIGKHVCFDGSLLHGAPSNKLLSQWQWDLNGSNEPNPQMSTATNDLDKYRFTFLVNVWLDHHPAGVNPLPSHIAEKVRQSVSSGTEQQCNLPAHESLELIPAEVGTVLQIKVTDSDAFKGLLPSEIEHDDNDSDGDSSEEEAEVDIQLLLHDNYQVLQIPFIPPPEPVGDDQNDSEEQPYDDAGNGEEGEDSAAGECGLSLRMILPPASMKLPQLASTLVTEIDRDYHCFHLRYDDECASVLQPI